MLRHSANAVSYFVSTAFTAGRLSTAVVPVLDPDPLSVPPVLELLLAVDPEFAGNPLLLPDGLLHSQTGGLGVLPATTLGILLISLAS